jgi:ribosome-associated translation inhibitor RaiA
MNIVVRFLGLEPSEMLREHCERQALFHLSRFGHDLRTVDIRIRDVNGPRGGVDKQCQVFATGPRLGYSTLQELSEDAYQAADAAISRLARTVARGLKRARDLKAGSHLVQ